MSSLEQHMQPPGHTWWDIIEEHARRFPERDALAHGQRRQQRPQWHGLPSSGWSNGT